MLLSDSLPCRTVFTWTAIISAFVQCEAWRQALSIYRRMEEDQIEPDAHTFVSLFKACGELSELAEGRKLHADAQKKGLTSLSFVNNTILSMYGKSEAIAEAENVFRAIPEPDLVSWNAMLSAFVDQGYEERALFLYRQMHAESVALNLLTHVIILQACGALAQSDNLHTHGCLNGKELALKFGQGLHADAIKGGYSADVLFGTTLISMYKKCGALSWSEYVFTTMVKHNQVSWTAMICAYAELGNGERALSLYRQMQVEGLSPNQLTYLFALQACVSLLERSNSRNGLPMNAKVFELARSLQADVSQDGFLEEPSICSTLLTLYGKCGALEVAENIFNDIRQSNAVFWTAMLSACVEQGESIKTLQLYELLKEKHIALDVVVLFSVLQACKEAGTLVVSEQVHFEIVSAGHDRLPLAEATLIHAYGGCASTENYHTVFNGACNPSIVLWNACCAGYGGEKGDLSNLELFEELRLAGLTPDEVTFGTILSTCSNIGDLDVGFNIFVSMMQEFGIYPDVRHYGSMIDLLARAGNFILVEDMLEKIWKLADYTVWFSILSACRIHGNLKLAKWAFEHAIRIMPQLASPYIMLSNIYAELGLHDWAVELGKRRQTDEDTREFSLELE
ncbi:hypothetical protein KP509_15G076300 [Ceratopteris richardii]|nr:hypothetical protein KP509_15G076300 [Ceratopteris richardii]